VVFRQYVRAVTLRDVLQRRVLLPELPENDLLVIERALNVGAFRVLNDLKLDRHLVASDGILIDHDNSAASLS
jgi:hypothetical protein